MASNTQGGLGAMFNGMAGGYMAGTSLQQSMADRKKADEEELAQRQREQDQQRQTEAERNQQWLQRMDQQQPQSQQGMGLGLDPSTMASAGSAFMGGGSGAGAGGASAAGGAEAGGTVAGSGAAGSGAMSGAAAAGPWAALAAIIAVNEKSARNGGHRADGWQYGKDLLGGKVVEQDANGRWSQKLGGYDDDKTGLLNDAGAGAEFTTLDFSNGAKKLKTGTPGKIVDAVKKIF